MISFLYFNKSRKSIFLKLQMTKEEPSLYLNKEIDMSDVSLGHTFAQVTCCLLSKVLYSKDQEAIQPSADHISCNRKNYLLRKSLSFLVPTSLPRFLCRGRVDIFRFISFSTFDFILINFPRRHEFIGGREKLWRHQAMLFFL